LARLESFLPRERVEDARARLALQVAGHRPDHARLRQGFARRGERAAGDRAFQPLERPGRAALLAKKAALVIE
jgi:hypothetical protein